MTPYVRTNIYPQIPNTLTSVRIVVALVIGYFALAEYLHWGPQAASDIFFWNRIAALALFIVACPTEYFDGDIARKNGWVSRIGEHLDPLADKLLAIACFGYAWVMFRESMHATVYSYVFVPTVVFIGAYSVITTTLRFRGIVGGASSMAKWKTLVQMVAMGFFLAAGAVVDWWPVASEILLYAGVPILIVSAAMCVPSLYGYWQSRPARRARAHTSCHRNFGNPRSGIAEKPLES